VPVLNLDSPGKPLSHATAVAGANRLDWLSAGITEPLKLIRDAKTPVPDLKPPKTPTYYNRVVRERWDPVLKRIVKRVRGTTGGGRIVSNYNVSSSVAALVTVKIFLNAAVTENANFATIGLTGFYLGALMPELEYIKIYVGTYRALTDFIHTEKSGKTFCYFAIRESMHGLSCAGKLPKGRLVRLLNASDFHESATPCLFRHATRNITFTLVVDGFGVKYTNPSGLTFLVD
jgi:hypothetical protein